MAWLKLGNPWIIRGARGAALWVVSMVVAMLLPAWVLSGPIGYWAYTIGMWIITGFVMWHIVMNIPGKA